MKRNSESPPNRNSKKKTSGSGLFEWHWASDDALIKEQERWARVVEEKYERNKKEEALRKKKEAERKAHSKEIDEFVQEQRDMVWREETLMERLPRIRGKDDDFVYQLEESRKQCEEFAAQSSSTAARSTAAVAGSPTKSTVTASVPVTNKKQSKEGLLDDVDSADDSSEERNRWEFPCGMCLQKKSQCYQKIFPLYCINAIENEFHINPLDTSISKYAKVKTLAFNKALDFKKYENNLKLMPHGFYYPPACMMKDFCKFMPLLEKDKDNYILSKNQFQQKIENRDLKDVESHDSDIDIPRMLCEHCGKDGFRCHRQLFAEYCYAHLHCFFVSYPTSITEENSKRVYLKWYNSALHFHTWETTHNYLRKLFVLPPCCLAIEM